MSKATHNPKSREDISNPHRHIQHEVLLVLGNVTDLRDNHTIETLPNGRIRIHPIDDSKKYTIDSFTDADVRKAIQQHLDNQDPIRWAQRVAGFICAEDAQEDETICLNNVQPLAREFAAYANI